MTKREYSIAGITALIMSIPVFILAHRQQPPELPSTAYEYSSIPVVPNKKGERRSFFDAPTRTLDQLECHVTTLNFGETSHPPHQHPEEELIIVKEGTVEVLVNGATKQVGPGSVIFQAANQMHNIKNAGQGRAVYHAIKWKSSRTSSKK